MLFFSSHCKSRKMQRIRGLVLRTGFLISSRSYSQNSPNALATLRRKTGYTISNCKKALDLHQNNLVAAEKWLNDQAQALGWSKAEKLEGRKTQQGLIGVLVRDNCGVMLEVNCETDFVARNKKFQEFLGASSATCWKYIRENVKNATDVSQKNLSSDDLKALLAADGKILSDHLALLIGTVGENAALRRGIGFKSEDSGVFLTGYAHPSQTEEDGFSFGKFGAVVAFRRSDTPRDPQLERKICQHIVGMNPKRIGDKAVDEANEDADSEDVLIHQEFIADATKTVGEILEESHLEVVNFTRFECGEGSE
ncbi:elongation factor Ts, mitochondrial [Lutzomyia longipalpis]|uniref:elongation factor Ts, mitochondrial n=1 Tax=Lutzomyia longipalpis TaxID=7200 RepID=UPI0024842C75|nr:elongation factor Ts, mitochondrial [Lutzomyia longipalpis]